MLITKLATLSYLSLIRHLHVHIPRMILSSSTVFSNQLLRATDAEASYDAICTRNGICAGAVNAVAALRELPVETLIANSAFAHSAFRPIWDDVTITSDPRKAVQDPSLWDPVLEQIVFGRCGNEVSQYVPLMMIRLHDALQSWMRLAGHPNGQPDLLASIDSRIPPSGNLRERARQLYGELSDFRWCGVSPGKLCPGTGQWLTLEGHARYYAVTPLLSESFLSRQLSLSGKQHAIYKYIFSWNTQHWPSDWPATHTADILPMFLHHSLSPEDLAVALTFADNLIAFSADETDQVDWSGYRLDDKCLNLLSSSGCWHVSVEGNGEFGLTPQIVNLWQDVVEATLEAGREGWVGMGR